MLPGNTTDKTTLADFLMKIETQYGKADRIWIMDRGIPTEDTLRQMRQCDPPVSYCLQVTLKARLKRCASGLTPRAVLEKFAAVQMLDVHLPTTDGREIILTRYTQPEKDLQLLLHELQLKLPEQAPPKIQAPPQPPSN